MQVIYKGINVHFFTGENKVPDVLRNSVLVRNALKELLKGLRVFLSAG